MTANYGTKSVVAELTEAEGLIIRTWGHHVGSTLSRAATNQTTLTEVTISVNQDIEIGAKEFILDRKAAYLSEGSIP